MALMGTSSRFDPSRRNRPTTRDTPTTAPRLHQVSPTSSATPTASSTPASTLAIRPTPLLSVCDIVSCTTSRAVSGASTGAALVPSCSAITKDSTAAAVVLAVRRPGTRPRRNRWRTPSLGASNHAGGSPRPGKAPRRRRPPFPVPRSATTATPTPRPARPRPGAYPGPRSSHRTRPTRSSCYIPMEARARARVGAPGPSRAVASPGTNGAGVGQTLLCGPWANAVRQARLASVPGRAADRK